MTGFPWQTDNKQREPEFALIEPAFGGDSDVVE